MAFVDLNFTLADLGFTGRICGVEGVSATKVVGFLLGVNGSNLSQNTQTPCKH
jgi:folate-dependent tRNA-U54 methylase TrmFO/GidA